MEKFKPGLKKEITAIFEDVRILKEIRAQQQSGASTPGGVGDLWPKFLSSNQRASGIRTSGPRLWSAPTDAAPKRSKIASIIRTFKQVPLRIFRPRAWRSQKRRMSISRHLLS